jgi:hypothetical protein
MNSTQITLHNTPSSPDLAKRLQSKCERLERVHPDLRHCRVKVAGPEPGAAQASYCVTLRVSVPGSDIACAPQSHAQVGVAVNRAFSEAAERLAALAPAPRTRAPRARHPMEASR